ncbi:hypothetical protein EG327_001787, partial [Venturia inaequalis]
DVVTKPGIPNYVGNIELFLEEWVTSDRVTVKGYGIPIKFWKNVFDRYMPEEWDVKKVKVKSYKY